MYAFVDVTDWVSLLVTFTSTVPVPVGDVNISCVEESYVTLVAFVAPNWTVGAGEFRKFVPIIVTVVPPDSGPVVGEIEVIVGAGGRVTSNADAFELY